jgi:hypothetical protein
MALSDRPYSPVNSNPSGLSVIAQNVNGAGPNCLPAQQAYNTTVETVVVSPSLVTVPLTVQIPPSTNLEQTQFEGNASGYITTGAAMTVTGKLYSGTSLTVGSDQLLGTTGAITQNSTTAPFYIKWSAIYDSVSKKLQGTFKALVNNTIVAEVAFSTVPTIVNNQNSPVATFLLSFTFSVANAANLVNLQKFSVG